MRSRRRDPAIAEASLPYFISGDENRLATFVCRSDTDLLSAANPILLVGPSGAGKTALALHLAAKLLLHANARRPPSQASDAQAAWDGYLVASEFARRYADGVDGGDVQPLRRQLDGAPVLVIDDLHSMADKPAAQEELAVRIGTRIDARLPTVLTCRRLPSDVRGMRPTLVSRSLPGLTIPLRLPEAGTRRLILGEFALLQSLEVDRDLLDLLAMGLPPEVSVRQLHAAIKQLALWCRMHDSPPTSLAVQSVLETLCRHPEVSISAITQRVARHFRLRAADLRSGSRRQNVVRARSLAMLLARKVTSLSLNQIGTEFGGRDHTTVLHAIRKTESMLVDDPELRRAAEEIGEKLAS